MPVALITGITGQDGSYLAELLLAKGYEVHGLVRRSSVLSRTRLEQLHHGSDGDRVTLHYGDLDDPLSLVRVLELTQPAEVYHLAAQSHVQISFDIPDYTGSVTGLGTMRLLEALRITGVPARFYQASSSEMFGSAPPPQHEQTPFHPRSPYAVAKVYAYWATVNYREAYGMFTANGILFNHESPRRGENFVTRKITKAVAAIEAGQQDTVHLGNLDARRDWGFAGDYVDAMWRMLQHDEPDDFVVATGEAHSVREFCEEAFGYAGLDYRNHVVVDPRYFRPAEVDFLLGDPTKTRDTLGWQPKTSFSELVRMMVDADRTDVPRPVNKLLKTAAIDLLALGRAYPTRLTPKADVESLLHSLAPRSSGKELVRFGPANDGGYLVPDDLTGVEACFSPGVNLISGFEKDCADRGMEVFMADRSVEGPAETHERFHFTRKYVGVTTNDDFMTVDDWVASSLPDTTADLMLQIDIEGYEYETFLAMSDRLMRRFRVIVAEFHDLDQLWNRPFFRIASRTFEKILQSHTCVHAHPNNHIPVLTKEGLGIAPATEFTFLRHDRIDGGPSAPFVNMFPHPFDADNTTLRPHAALPKCWYR